VTPLTADRALAPPDEDQLEMLCESLARELDVDALVVSCDRGGKRTTTAYGRTPHHTARAAMAARVLATYQHRAWPELSGELATGLTPAPEAMARLRRAGMTEADLKQARVNWVQAGAVPRAVGPGIGVSSLWTPDRLHAIAVMHVLTRLCGVKRAEAKETLLALDYRGLSGSRQIRVDPARLELLAQVARDTVKRFGRGDRLDVIANHWRDKL